MDQPYGVDPVEGARLLVEASDKHGVRVQVLGGVAVRMICPSAGRPPLLRAYNDIDVAVAVRGTAALTAAAADVGMEADRRFNALNGSTRMLFHWGEMPIDVFVGVFQQCHTLDLEPSLARPIPTLTPEYLLLTKLQVVTLTDKDCGDICALLLDHPPDEGADGMETGTLQRLAGQDWGWYTTIGDTLAKVDAYAEHLPEMQATAVRRALGALRTTMEAQPKSLSWRLRARVGRRVRWYENPEEK